MTNAIYNTNYNLHKPILATNDKTYKYATTTWLRDLIKSQNISDPVYSSIAFNCYMPDERLVARLNILFKYAYKDYYNYHKNWFYKYYNSFPKCVGVIESGANNQNTHIHFVFDMNDKLKTCFSNSLIELRKNKFYCSDFLKTTLDFGYADNNPNNFTMWTNYMTKSTTLDSSFRVLLLDDILKPRNHKLH